MSLLNGMMTFESYCHQQQQQQQYASAAAEGSVLGALNSNNNNNNINEHQQKQQQLLLSSSNCSGIQEGSGSSAAISGCLTPSPTTASCSAAAGLRLMNSLPVDMMDYSAMMYKSAAAVGWGAGPVHVPGPSSFAMLEDQFSSSMRGSDFGSNMVDMSKNAAIAAAGIYPALLRSPQQHLAQSQQQQSNALLGGRQSPSTLTSLYHAHHTSAMLPRHPCLYGNMFTSSGAGSSGTASHSQHQSSMAQTHNSCVSPHPPQHQQQHSSTSPSSSLAMGYSFDPQQLQASANPCGSSNDTGGPSSPRSAAALRPSAASLYMGFDRISHHLANLPPGSCSTPGAAASVSATSSNAAFTNASYAHPSLSANAGAAAYMQYSGTTMTTSGVSLPTALSYTLPHFTEIDYDPRDLEAFAERFKQRRIKLGVTQADVGKALGNLKLTGVGSLSQSTICRFESLTLSHNNMVALKPVLHAWLEEAERQAAERQKNPDIYGESADKKRKRTSITDAEKRSLEAFFAVQPRPSSEKISQIADKLHLKKNVVRVWFCNQRQKQKRMKFSHVAIAHHS